MAEVVLVHGIAQEHKSAAVLEAEWLPWLAGGVCRARGMSSDALADRLWRNRSSGDGIDARMAFYGHLFLTQGAQGAALDDLTGDEAVLAEQLALEWLTTAVQRATPGRDRSLAELELNAVVGGESGAQGLATVVRPTVIRLSRIPWFARSAANAAVLVKRAVRQVTLYMTNDNLRMKAIEAVLSLVGADTRIIIGHSLGSVVAYEALQSFKFPSASIALFLTLGSPLGLPNIIYSRLHPQPPRFPARVHQWINIAAEDDLVASPLDLSALFASGKPPNARFEGWRRVDNGSSPHRVEHYLSKVEVGQPVAQALAGLCGNRAGVQG